MNVVDFVKDAAQKNSGDDSKGGRKTEQPFKSFADFLSGRFYKSFYAHLQWLGFDAFPEDSAQSRDELTPEAVRLRDSMSLYIGKEIYVSDWFEVTQERINQFAAVTGDNQWIHTDAERAKLESPFRSTIAHGFLTLALLPRLTQLQVLTKKMYPNPKLIVNAGLYQVRFPYPAKSGAFLRARATMIDFHPQAQSGEVVFKVIVEEREHLKCVCMAETVVRLYV